MSRLQRTFNALVEDVADLESRLARQSDDLELLLARYQLRVVKSERAHAKAQFSLAATLAAANQRLQLRGNQKKDLAATLCDLCEDAFVTMVPDAEIEALYDEWSQRSYREMLDRAAATQQQEPEEDSEHDSDDDGAPNAAEGPSDGDEEDLASEADGEGAGNSSGGPRSFAARKARRLEQADFTRRSVRQMYLSLARVLHPDTVSEPSERAGREEAMKQAAEAYAESDLLSLLRLELRWIRRENDPREELGDDTLRAYIRALREQVAKLEVAIASQAADPRYDPIAAVAFLPRKRALAELEDRAKQLRAATAELTELRAIVHASESRKELAAIVRGARHYRG